MLPKLEIHHVFFDCLKKLDVPIVFICNSYSEGALEEVITKIEFPTIFVTDHIPAQIILTDYAAIYSNVDFERCLEYNDRGIGFRINREKHRNEYYELMHEFEGAIRCGTCITDQRNLTRDDLGHCIRCKEKIPLIQVEGLRAYEFKPWLILCNPCFEVWSIYENYEYEERYCYICGEYNDSSVAYPLCRSCFREHNY